MIIYSSARHVVELTEKVPLAAGLVVGRVNLVLFGRQVNLVAVIRPRAELERAVLVVEREPADVDRARRDEQAENGRTPTPGSPGTG